ncbi:YqiA/YcfP family alpha/beta fold hydrolase [Calothrix sp. UHCC 0171]|uniref:YqiA/YcfP family alpha/beta fold hydrolase n=1 Tax=Calothrix sp. UHCC 0171 TaxID=3110245 RepID=UPI002B2135FB|nr:YqiA/YcfP family alpha/beta fold hydrolase [Calothrix sp. UHCC 0171]MEA5571376.1 YqiA/YcfP family alpha/beta fold hydrolase [Calothrix sp. UHCC 0171]
MKYIYLHGFASSPNSVKSREIQSYFQQLQIDITIPDLNAGDFSHLTITRQYHQVIAEISAPNEPDKTPVTLIGSSLGGLTSAHIAENYPQVQRLVLLAPAFGFLSHWLTKLGDDKIQKWQQEKYLMVYHYREQAELPLHYNFITDAAQYTEDKLKRPIPTLILHGIHDEVIPVSASRNFANQRPWVELVELESDHALGNVIDEIEQAISRFCQIP